MENQSMSPLSEPRTKTRRKLKPEVAARLAQGSPADLSRLYAKPLEQLTEVELRRMKQAFLRGL